MMNAKTLMIQGTTSDAGKSTLVTGLCRVLARRGVRVAPFKPQNMALNSAVTINDGEIGRAQAVQAQACGLPPHTDMNPVLLKPTTDVGTQVIIHGHAISSMDARAYHDYKTIAFKAVMDSYARLSKQYDAIVVEGAGSPAEINLRDKDIANMGFAEAVDCPVLLIADIDRGGVFAHLVGTLELLSKSEQARVAGFIINRFRGDIDLLMPGIEWLQTRTHKPVLGVLPYLHGLYLEAEDALPRTPSTAMQSDTIRIIVPALPRISNHTDFDSLRLHSQVNLQYIGPGQEIPGADLIILPGSKNVRADLAWLRTNGWEQAIPRHLRYGGKVIGICGGFQMLGQYIHDPLGLEGAAGSAPGLQLLEIVTTLEREKQLRRVDGRLTLENAPVSGYEIHHGITQGLALERPLIKLSDGCDGAISNDDKILGSYLHGLFDTPQACQALLRWAGLNTVQNFNYGQRKEQDIDLLADTVERHLDMKHINKLLGLAPTEKLQVNDHLFIEN